MSLEEIAAATRISTRFLEALESGQWDQLPGGAFNRGFIRSTARFLGLNEDSMVAEYAQEAKGQAESKTLDSSLAPMPRDLRPLGVAIVVVFLTIIGIGYGYHLYHWPACASKPPQPLRLPHRSASATSGPVDANSTASTSPVGNIPAPATTPTSDPTKTATKAAVPTAPSVLTLKIEDGKSARIKVVADGKTLFDGRIRPKTEKLFEARDGFEVTSNESSALSLELNGQAMPIPSGPLGKPIVLSRQDLKAADGSR